MRQSYMEDVCENCNLGGEGALNSYDVDDVETLLCEACSVHISENRMD